MHTFWDLTRKTEQNLEFEGQNPLILPNEISILKDSVSVVFHT